MDLASIHGHVDVLDMIFFAGIKWNLKSMIFWRISHIGVGIPRGSSMC